MSPEIAHQIFFVRFYKWALKDFQLDCEMGFPILSMFERHNRAIQCGLHWLRGMVPENRQAVCRAKVRYAFREQALPLLGETLSEEEQRLVLEAEGKYKFYNKEQIIPPLPVTNPLLDPQKRSGSLDKRSLNRAIAEKLEAKGLRIHRVTRNEVDVQGVENPGWHWNLAVANYNPFRGVYTKVELYLTCLRKDIPPAGPGWQLFMLRRHTFLFYWGWNAYWTLCNDESIPEVADAVAKVSHHMLGAILPLTAGLSADDEPLEQYKFLAKCSA